MAKAVHMMVRVREEARSVGFYQAAFGLSVADRVDFETFTLIYLRNAAADFELELTVNKGQSAPYELGTGYGHLAFVVDDLAGEHARLLGAGLAPKDIKQMVHEGRPFGQFFFIDDPDGYKIEVLQKGGRFT
jgi:lactoylglutathione lyase